MFFAAKLPAQFRAITITAGSAVSNVGRGFHLAKSSW
jgi:hypothetical protein